MKKLLLPILILVCLGINYQRIYSFYRQTVPPFREGTCLVVDLGGGVPPLSAKVLKNEGGKSLVALRMEGLVIGAYSSYEELRELHTLEVPCQ